MLARASGAAESVLRALVAFDLGVFESRPVRVAVSKARDVAVHDLIESGILKLGRPGMPRDTHAHVPSVGRFPMRKLVPRIAPAPLRAATGTDGGVPPRVRGLGHLRYITKTGMREGGHHGWK